MIADSWREEVLKVQNTNRRRLAKNQQQGSQGLLPSAKDMNELMWDCSIEEMARTVTTACTDPATKIANYGVVSKMISVKASSCNVTTDVVKEVKTIWKNGAAKQADQAKVPDNDDFSQMAYAKTNGVGCSYNWCSGKLYFACYYNQDGTTANPDLYDAGNGVAETCATCAANNKCFDYLCKEDLPAVEPTSTICTDPNLQNVKLMTDELRNTALNMHNYYRRLLASGWAKDKQLTYAKPATAMPKLEYDCDVEDKIMNTLKDCGGIAATPAGAQTNNFKLFTPYTSTREEALSKVIEDWWSYLEKTGMTDNKYDSNNAGMVTFANMAYDQTTKVGCGVKVCQNTGNIEVQCGYVMNPIITDDDPIYNSGKPCSKCGKLNPAKTCSKLGGLCE
ncbi:SCP-like protein [Ancylostoma caninum]|uniref:SCP-like protein n=1 Tax=Ancylostoma caninum TaxID=29170 RepID=A0A368GSA1_ANCCA|nr:SCP-like protein [Ancylostoma caninum]